MRNWTWGFVGLLYLALLLKIEALKFHRTEQTERISGTFSFGSKILCFSLELYVISCVTEMRILVHHSNLGFTDLALVSA